MADAKARGTMGVWRPGLPDKTRVELKSATRDLRGRDWWTPSRTGFPLARALPVSDPIGVERAGG